MADRGEGDVIRDDVVRIGEKSLVVVGVEVRRLGGRADVIMGALLRTDVRGREREVDVRGVRERDVRRGMSRGILDELALRDRQ